MLTSETAIKLPEDIFKLIQDMVYEYCGVLFDNDLWPVFENRLQKSIRRIHLDNFKDYYFYLKYDRDGSEEFNRMLDLLTNHETYFFREEPQLKAFTDEILPELLDTDHPTEKTLRIWSAGCSTGEEAYSLSMLILEQKYLKDWNIEIISSDVSHRVLQSARRGTYSNPSFRVTAPYYISKYFKKDGEVYRIDDSVRKNVTFVHINLVDADRLDWMGDIDIIFCRNVLIYFPEEIRKKVITTFSKVLKPGGFLLLGHSESLFNLSTAFDMRHLEHDIAYQKPKTEAGA